MSNIPTFMYSSRLEAFSTRLKLKINDSTLNIIKLDSTPFPRLAPICTDPCIWKDGCI